MSCTGRTAIADNAENRFIWKISCVLKVFALGMEKNKILFDEPYRRKRDM